MSETSEMEEMGDATGGTCADGVASDDMTVHFLAEGEQQPQDIATLLADFLRGARRSLDIAIYDFRLSEPLRQIVASALADAATSPEPPPCTGMT